MRFSGLGAAELVGCSRLLWLLVDTFGGLARRRCRDLLSGLERVRLRCDGALRDLEQRLGGLAWRHCRGLLSGLERERLRCDGALRGLEQRLGLLLLARRLLDRSCWTLRDGGEALASSGRCTGRLGSSSSFASSEPG